MRGYIKQYADGAFDPAVINVLEDAFEDAWRRVQASKAPYSAGEYASAGCTIIAIYIPYTSSIKPRQESVILVGWLTARSYISRSKN